MGSRRIEFTITIKSHFVRKIEPTDKISCRYGQQEDRVYNNQQSGFAGRIVPTYNDYPAI